jgi:hypothetical protein
MLRRLAQSASRWVLSPDSKRTRRRARLVNPSALRLAMSTEPARRTEDPVHRVRGRVPFEATPFPRPGEKHLKAVREFLRTRPRRRFRVRPAVYAWASARRQVSGH